MDLSLIRYELVLAGIAILLLLADIFLPFLSKTRLGFLTALALFLIMVWDYKFPAPAIQSGAPSNYSSNAIVFDHLAVWAKYFALITTLLSVLCATRFYRNNSRHLIEFILLQLAACLGMMLVASARNFLSFFISLELMTVCFYVMVSFGRTDVLSLEAGVKYLIYGALASGIMLYGIALIYGASGSFGFNEIAQFATANQGSKLFFAGFLLLLVGLLFKISGFPFHWWTPDVYEGAPTPTVALLSIGSKASGFIILVRVLVEAFEPYRDHWFPLICVASLGSILIGNLGALSQNNLKRIMGYSSISHTGYMLLGITVSTVLGMTSIFYYLLGYLFANALVFAAMCETHEENPLQELRKYAGLGKRSTWAAAALTVGLLSLTGIPPLAGFFGKLLLLGSVWNEVVSNQPHGRILLTLLVGSALGIVCSFYYYLNIIRSVYFSDAAEAPTAKLEISKVIRWVIALLIVAVFAMGFYQFPVMRISEIVARSLGFN